MNIQHIQFFVSCSQKNSITATAESLHITPSGIRLALHRLEDELGVNLIVWGGHGFELTDNGKFFLEKAYDILSAYESCISYFSGQQRYEILRIASGIHFPTDSIGDAMSDFRRENPFIYFDMTDYPSTQCDCAVQNGSVDLGFNTGPFSDANFEYYPILSYSLLAVVNKSNPLSRLDALPITALENHEVVTAITKAQDTDFAASCQQYGVVPKIVTRCMRDHVIFRRISLNPEQIGITYEEISRQVNFPNIKVMPFDVPPISKTVYLFHRKKANLSHSTIAFKKYILDRFNNQA